MQDFMHAKNYELDLQNCSLTSVNFLIEQTRKLNNYISNKGGVLIVVSCPGKHVIIHTLMKPQYIPKQNVYNNVHIWIAMSTISAPSSSLLMITFMIAIKSVHYKQINVEAENILVNTYHALVSLAGK